MKDIDIRDHIRAIPDFPKPGILFYDISTFAGARGRLVGRDGASRQIGKPAPRRSCRHRITRLSRRRLRWRSSSALASLWFASAVSPGATIRYEYALEYGSDVIEIQSDAVQAGQRLVVLDDLLATGGTMGAAVDLFRTVGAEVVGSACIIELTFLQGRKRLDVPFSTPRRLRRIAVARSSARFPLQRQWRLIAVGKRQTRNLLHAWAAPGVQTRRRAP